MKDPADADDAPVEPPDLLQYSKVAIRQRAALIAHASDMLEVSNALTVQWIEMNRRFFDRANRRLEAATENIVDSERSGDAPMSYYERSEKFQGVTMENAKDYMQQFERFSLGASVLMQRVVEKYGQSLMPDAGGPTDE